VIENTYKNRSSKKEINRHGAKNAEGIAAPGSDLAFRRLRRVAPAAKLL